MKKHPKYIKEFQGYLSNGFLYTQLIHQTVAIYKSLISDIAKGKRKPPRASGTLLREAMEISKNHLSRNEKYLTEDGIPTPEGIASSVKLIGKDEGKTPLMRKAFLAPYILGAAMGDYTDDSFVSAVESYKAKHTKGRGSRNVSHTCKTESSLRKELNTIRKAMDEIFSCNTAFGTCNNNSMSSGHCMLSALIIQDRYGGKIISGSVDGIPHYWNRLCHLDVDLTGDQFRKPKVQIRKDNLYGADSFAFNRSPFESLNQDFNKEVWGKHCAFRQKLRKELEGIDPKLAEKLKSASKKLKR